MDRTTRMSPLLLSFSWLLLGACDSGEPRDPEPRSDDASELVMPMAAPEGAGAAGIGEVGAEADSEPAPVREGEALQDFLRMLEPVSTRAGHLRFTAPEVATPEATQIFAARLVVAAVPQGQRLALAEVLHRSGGDWSAASLLQLGLEEDPQVRAILVGTLAKAPTEAARRGLVRGLADPDPQVRRAACELAGVAAAAGGDDSVRASLLAALTDDDAAVRGAAARAQGLLGQSTSFAAVMSGLADVDAEVRLQSLRALQRIDRARAAALPEVAALAADAEDARVKRVATQLRAEVHP